MDWPSPETKGEDAVALPKTWLHIHYYEALSTLFRVENSLRVFVYAVLKDDQGTDWTEISLPSENGDSKGVIRSIAKQRITQERKFGYLGYETSNPLMYLTSGELVRLITSDAYWEKFNDYFDANKSVVRSKLEEVGTVRNALAHFRPLKEDDVEVVKQNAKQMASGIEDYLQKLVSCSDNVPTNTSEDWYQELDTLGTEACTLKFSQSTDEKWVRIRLEYDCRKIDVHEQVARFFIVTYLNIVGPAILTRSEALREFMIYASSGFPYSPIDLEGEGAITKHIDLVFSREQLNAHYSEIRDELDDLLTTISQESELIRQDNLARGDVVEAVSSSLFFKEDEEKKQPNYPEALYGVKPDHPPEWWGQIRRTSSNFISRVDSFPWMPATIAEYSYR